MTLAERIESLAKLGEIIHQDNAQLADVVELSYRLNPWFTSDNVWKSLGAIRDEFLNKEKLTQWTSNYTIDSSEMKTIGLVLAGNIPLVGWHDMLCCYVAGHKAMVKYSDKDKTLIPYLIEQLIAIEPRAKAHFEAVDKLSGFDGVIATGSNNTSKYFQHYFGKYPNIIRANRNSVAILTGEETDEEILALGADIFNYFGLGCRNVSSCFAKEGLDWNRYLEIWHDAYKELAHHNKYKNNFDHNISLFILNKEKFLNNGCLIIKEDASIPSRISSMHYQYYSDESELQQLLHDHAELLQCVVSAKDYNGVRSVRWGEAQQPNLSDYADGVDTMAFLTGLV